MLKQFFVLLWLLIYLSPTITWAELTSSQLYRLQNLLLNNGVKKSKTELVESEKLFAVRTASHRIRLMELFKHLKNDPKFVQNFPEYKELLSQPERALHMISTHDVGKTNPDIQNSIKALSWLQGVDQRVAIKGLDPKVDQEIRGFLKQAIDDVNKIDNQFPPLNDFEKKVDSLVTVLDFYDTYKSRQDEISKDGRKLKKPSEWLHTLPQQGDLDHKLKLATFLEDSDPLKNKHLFTQVSDLSSRIGPDFKKDAIHAHLESHRSIRKELRESRKIASEIIAKSSGALSRLAPAAGRIVPIAGATLSVASYLDEPEDFNLKQYITDLGLSLTLTQDLGACDTVKCSTFFRQCGQKINSNNLYNPKEISKKPEFIECIKDFFELPLHLQSELREDFALDQIFSNYGPRFVEVSCAIKNLSTPKKPAKDHLQIEFTTRINGELDQQLIKYSNTSDDTVEMMTRLPDNQDIILYKNNQAESLRHCNIGHKCQSFQMDKVKTEKNYFWKDENFTIIPESLVDKIPTNSFIWAKYASKAVELQNQKLKSCCNEKKCRDYFNEIKLHRAEYLKRKQSRIPSSSDSYFNILSPEELSAR